MSFLLIISHNWKYQISEYNISCEKVISSRIFQNEKLCNWTFPSVHNFQSNMKLSAHSIWILTLVTHYPWKCKKLKRWKLLLRFPYSTIVCDWEINVHFIFNDKYITKIIIKLDSRIIQRGNFKEPCICLSGFTREWTWWIHTTEGQ